MSSPFSEWLEVELQRFAHIKAKPIAKKAGVSEGYFSALRTGRKVSPTPDIQRRIHAALEEVSGQTVSKPPEASEVSEELPVPIEKRSRPRRFVVVIRETQGETRDVSITEDWQDAIIKGDDKSRIYLKFIQLTQDESGTVRQFDFDAATVSLEEALVLAMFSLLKAP